MSKMLKISLLLFALMASSCGGRNINDLRASIRGQKTLEVTGDSKIEYADLTTFQDESFDGSGRGHSFA